jgi:tetratricopeptide (TPR) repeat protein
VTRRWAEEADSLEAAGDSANARFPRWLGEMVEARAQWGAGDPEGALERLVSLQARATGWQFLQPVNEMLRTYVADLYLELGDEDEAERYYRSLVDRPRAVLALARLRDEAGDTEEAAAYYARVIQFWEEADPELQPLVEEARVRLQEIVRERG